MENSILKDFLDPEEIPFMNYGIINKYNFKEIDNVPIKRWDPLSASFIHLYQSTMSNPVIISKKFGQYSYISPVRSNRPFERKKDIETQENSQNNEDDSHNLDILMDLFDPMLKGKHYKINEQKYLPAYSIIIADGNKKLDNPFSDRIKIYPNLQGKAVSMINKFPAMVRVIDPDIYPEITRSLLKIDKKSQIARGVCFLTIPRFYHETVEDMTSEELRDLFISMTTSINYIIEESISQKDTSIIPISPFFNVGASVGGSLRRLHCQIYMDLSQDGHGSRMESFLKTFEKMNERNQCQICDSKHGDGSRIIFDTEDWVIFSSGSPIRNYHLRFAPKEHIEDLSKINAKKFLSLAKTLKVLSMVLNDMGVNNERNIIFNTRPYGYNSYFHLFGDILPYEHVGGAEMADSMRVVRISPKKVAKDARKIIRTKYSNLL